MFIQCVFSSQAYAIAGHFHSRAQPRCVPSPSRDVVCKFAHWDFRHCTLHHLRRLCRLWIATCVEVSITVVACVFQVISLLQLCDVVALFGVLLVTAWRWWFSVAVCWGCDAVNLLRLCLDAWRLDTAKCGLVSQTSIFVCVCVEERGGGGGWGLACFLGETRLLQIWRCVSSWRF